MKRPCEICGGEAAPAAGGCTNARCAACHGKWCTAGGDTSPGHARRWPAKPGARATVTVDVQTTPEGAERIRAAVASGELLRSLQERGLDVNGVGIEERRCTGEHADEEDDGFVSREDIERAREERDSTAGAAGGRDE